LGSLVKEKFIASVTWTVIGSYFHILVGGWFFIFLFIYLVIYKNAWSKAIIYSAVYIAILLPIIIYLYKGGVKDFHATALGLNVNEILAYYRSPHHLGLFKSAYYFFYNHLPGVLFTLSWFTLCIFYFRKINDSLIQRLNKMNIILFSMLLISLIIGIFDRGGWYIKYFPYRIGALSMLLVIIQTTLMLKKLAIKESFGQYLNRAILIICLPMTVYTTAVNFDQSYFNYFKSHPQEEALYSFIQDSTARESVVHLYQFENLSFTRKTRRDRYVVEKFFPMKSRKIREWYLRMEIDKEIQTDDNFFYLFKENSVIDYIISKKRISIPDSKEVFKNETYFVYKL
ncbi:MAG: hypothetical protein IIA45_15715, partial [Bacteroidetes bacterium]|nr:hypothetical protein [Bacteroidota bacterium]